MVMNGGGNGSGGGLWWVCHSLASLIQWIKLLQLNDLEDELQVILRNEIVKSKRWQFVFIDSFRL
jgi:hypothetical protein